MTTHGDRDCHPEDMVPSRINDLCDELRVGLGTDDMSLEQMLKEMRRIRETSDDKY